MKNKFNCVDMKHKGAEKIQAQLKGLNIEDELSYWKKQTKELKDKQKRLSKLSSTDA